MAESDTLPTVAEPLSGRTFYRDQLFRSTGPFPFRRVLDLASLIEFWRHVAEIKWGKYFAGEINRQLDERPELLGPIDDPAMLEPHMELVQAMLVAAFPPAMWDRSCMAAVTPFHLQSFYTTPTYRRLLLNEEGKFIGRLNVDSVEMEFGKTLHAYLFILKSEYGIDIPMNYPIIITARDNETGLDRYFAFNFDTRFVKVHKVGNPPAPTDEELTKLRANLTDLTLWKQLFPPEQYELHGFTVIEAIEVTYQEVLSALKRDLIEDDAILSLAGIARLQDRMRTLMRCSDLELGIAAVEGDEVLLLNYSSAVDTGCLYTDSVHYRISDMVNSIYMDSFNEQAIKIVEDLREYPHITEVEQGLLHKGVRAMMVAPLQYRDETIGMLQLWSGTPGALNTLSALVLNEVLSLFALVVRRSTDTLNNRVQSIIREKYTAIHPSVEWRFRRAALNYIQNSGDIRELEIEPVVFTDVYPLYSISDIRGSSLGRNSAIQADLLAHLELVRTVLVQAQGVSPLPIFDNLLFRIDSNAATISAGLSSGDEAGVIEFIRRDIEPVFDHLQQLDPALRRQIEAYHAQIDPHLGSIYHKRREFEDSVAAINRAISVYIEEEQVKAQSMFPHYFEKHKSDGVDMGLYIGASLVEHRQWNMLYLRNLRLWQLLTLCNVARLADRLKPELKVPLDATHLILVQHSPLAIRFHQDEKQFDVDGAYNIRYEIMKKRIDKAVIRGTGERLTQPGMIAIVYSQNREAAEYRQYLDFLRASGYIEGEVEDVELEDLQGVYGLRALRTAVQMNRSETEDAMDAEAIERAIRAIVTDGE